MMKQHSAQHQHLLIYIVVILVIFTALATLSISDARAASSDSAEKLRIVLLDIQAKDIPIGEADSVRQIIRYRIMLTVKTLLCNPDEVNAIVEKENISSEKFDDRDTAAYIGRMVRADYVVFGRIVAGGEGAAGNTIDIRVVNTDSREIVYVDQEKDSGGLVHAADALSQRLSRALFSLEPTRLIRYEERALSGPALYIRCGYVQPLGGFVSESAGYAVLGSAGVLLSEFFMGLRSGYIGFTGPGSASSSSALPLQFEFSYTIKSSSNVYFSPLFCFGAAYITIGGAAQGPPKFEPFITAGFDLGYRLHRHVGLSLYCDFSAITRDRATVLYMITAALGIVFNF